MTEGSTRAEEMVGRGIRQPPVAKEISIDPSETDPSLESVGGGGLGGVRTELLGGWSS